MLEDIAGGSGEDEQATNPHRSVSEADTFFFSCVCAALFVCRRVCTVCWCNTHRRSILPSRSSHRCTASWPKKCAAAACPSYCRTTSRLNRCLLRPFCQTSPRSHEKAGACCSGIILRQWIESKRSRISFRRLLVSLCLTVVCPLQIPGVSSSLLGAGESVASFSARLHKSANMLAAELFGTQLRMIRGVSAGLALSVIERYPCARALCEAYERCASVEEEEALLQDLSRGLHQSAGQMHSCAAVQLIQVLSINGSCLLTFCFCGDFCARSGEVWGRRSVSRFAPSFAAKISIEPVSHITATAVCKPRPSLLVCRCSLKIKSIKSIV